MRVLPNALDVEKSLLGAAFLHWSRAAEIADKLDPAEFYSPLNGRIAAAIRTVIENGQTVDPLAVAAELTADDATSETYLDAARGIVASATHEIDTHVAIVADNAAKRALIAGASDVVERLFAGGDADAALDALHAVAANTHVGGAKLVSSPQGAAMAFDWQSAPQGEVMPTGLRDLDETLSGGLAPGRLYVVGARPGMGKTVMATNIAIACSRAGHDVLLKSMEMQATELWTRMFAQLAASPLLTLTHLQRREVVDHVDRSTKLLETERTAAEQSITIDDTGEPTLGGIRAAIRGMRHRPQILIVDYLQLMNGPGENRQQEISRISRDLKQLAMELDIAVVALSQLSRNLESRADRRPMLADLRDSGSIEQDADVVMFLYRDEVYNTESMDIGMVEVSVAKQRNGPTGLVRAAWVPHHALMADMAAEQ